MAYAIKSEGVLYAVTDEQMVEWLEWLLELPERHIGIATRSRGWPNIANWRPLGVEFLDAATITREVAQKLLTTLSSR